MLKYQIFFEDGGTLGHVGTIRVKDNVFNCFGDDGLIRLLIPIEKVKYIRVN